MSKPNTNKLATASYTRPRQITPGEDSLRQFINAENGWDGGRTYTAAEWVAKCDAQAAAELAPSGGPLTLTLYFLKAAAYGAFYLGIAALVARALAAIGLA
jgi:hypothetical protein